MSLIREKIQQARQFVAQSNLDAWITFVRETGEGSDPVLPFLIEGGLTWQSALIIFRDGWATAIVGNYDADPLIASGNWDEVVPYVQGIREPLLNVLARIESDRPRLGLNFSKDDVKADGLTAGMRDLLDDYVRGTRFEGTFESAAETVMRLRGIKTATEVSRIREALRETDVLFSDIEAYAYLGVTEKRVFDFTQELMISRNLGFSWDRHGDPIVNFGPNSMVGHGIPSASISLEVGQILHVDLGVICNEYASDIQRCWYVGSEIPPEVTRAFNAVIAAITAGSEALKPGVAGHQVDLAARTFLINAGYPEYLHAFGHQVGRVAHDGGGILGPRWERYGNTPNIPIEVGQIYTLELGVFVADRGYVGIEEMVRVTEVGCEFLSLRQMELKAILGG